MPVRKQVQTWLNRMNKRKDGGSIDFASRASFLNIVRFGTGSLDLDIAVGGGWPRHRMVLIFGPEGAGKTTLAIRACAELKHWCTKCFKHRTLCSCKDFEQGRALWLDGEGAFVPDWSISNGFDPEEHVIFRPRYGEEAVDVVTDAIREKLFDIIVIDSIESLVPAGELEKSAEDATIGLLAKMMNRALRTWNQAMMDVGKMAPTIILINQCREKVGIMFGDTLTLPGGKGQNFWASIRVRLKRASVEGVKDGTAQAFVELSGSVPKNKVGIPKKEFSLTVALQDYDEYKAGEINNIEAFIKYGRKTGHVKTGGGNWYVVDNDKKELTAKVKGRERLVEEIRSKGGEFLWMCCEMVKVALIV